MSTGSSVTGAAEGFQSFGAHLDKLFRGTDGNTEAQSRLRLSKRWWKSWRSTLGEELAGAKCLLPVPM